MQEINVGVIGFGTVGTGVIQFLMGERARQLGLRLSQVLVSDVSKTREIKFSRITDRPDVLLEDPEIDIVVELMGGEQPALNYIKTALNRGKSVVTANKVVVSRHLPELVKITRNQSVDLAFEASVAGGIPVIRLLNGLVAENVRRVTGILNGTSNYVLSRMEEGLDFQEAVRLAQEQGFAEADHTLDTGGFDARDKLAIIASIVYETFVHPESVYCEGITGITPVDLDFAAKYGLEEGEPGYVVKLLASAERVETDDSLELYVYPALIRKDHPLAAVRGEMNAVYLEGEGCGPQLYSGRGAGREATASAVISDVVRLAENRRRGVNDRRLFLDRSIARSDIGSLQRRAYVRVNLKHRPGSLAKAAMILSEYGFNIEDSIQRRRFKTERNGATFIPDIMTVEPLGLGVVHKALEALKQSDRIHGQPFYLRFEN